MNTIVFNKLSGQVIFEEKAKEVERSSRNYLEVIDGQHPDMMIPNSQSKENARHRRSGYVLHLLQARYVDLVSNWFANARRRLKNTVRQPDLSWALRIKLYNKYVQGNAERLSVSSDDTCSEDGEHPPRNQANAGEFNKPIYQSVIKKEGPVVSAGLRAVSSLNEDYVSPPKYKSSLLHRYLNDSLHHVMASTAAITHSRKRNHSGSFSSNEYEEELLSPTCSEAEANFVYRAETVEHGSSKCDNGTKERGTCKDETYWREIHAAMALTNLAQGKDKVSGTTSCIIQKSSHISEIKTVKVPLAQTF
ncbi:Homeobox protein Mohawk [Acipenser ruthenus]|uniref:Homeobox protein Mohawk n=1 Tax=Acipenser ruthenus TaxID=7906 RepID=A0A444ULC8_ACIRT|nr:Homeobox protein Mohawk [Acipenser ruthenus]